MAFSNTYPVLLLFSGLVRHSKNRDDPQQRQQTCFPASDKIQGYNQDIPEKYKSFWLCLVQHYLP